MRAFTKAAALLLAQSVVAESIPGTARRVSATGTLCSFLLRALFQQHKKILGNINSSVAETIPTAYVTLKVPLEEVGAQTVVSPGYTHTVTTV